MKLLPHSIFVRTAVLLVLLFLLTSLFILQQQKTLTRLHSQQMQQQLHSNLAASLVKEYQLFENRDRQINQQQIKQLFHKMMVLGPNFEFYLLDNNGRILAHALPSDEVILQRVDTEAIKAYLNQQPLPIFGDNPKNPDIKTVFNAAPVYMDDTLTGYLYIIIGSSLFENLNERFEDNRSQQMGWYTLLALLVFALAAGLLLFFTVAKPVRQLAKDVEACNQDPQKSICTYDCQYKKDEVSLLRQRFHALTEQLRQQNKVLEENDSNRRRMISYISHDLRTPLTNIEGYIETLQLNPTLTESDRANLLEIIARHTQKLNHLINQLFELAKLDSSAKPLQCELFDLAELASDIVQQESKQAHERGIQITIRVADTSLKVYADIHYIERTLTNLIQNAIRHSPDHSTIEISLSQIESRIRVAVIDQGVGISEEDIPMVCAPHYQASNSLSDAPGGLGLAICQRVLQLHGSTLEIDSTLGEGSCFAFSLEAQHNI